MYTKLSETQRSKLYKSLYIEERLHDETRFSEKECFLAFGQGLSAKLSVNENAILSVVIKSNNEDSDTESLEDLSEDFQDVVSDIITFIRTITIDEVNSDIRDLVHTGRFDTPPYSVFISVSVRNELLDISTQEYEVEVNGKTNIVPVPVKYESPEEVYDYLEQKWWRCLSNSKKLKKAGISSWDLQADSVSKADRNA